MNPRLTRTGLVLGRLSLSPEAIFAAAVLFYLGVDPVLTACLTAAAVHETGHLTACLLLGVPVYRLRLTLLGAVLDTEAHCHSGGEELLVALAGPLVNLMCVPVFLAVPESEGARLFAAASLLLGLFNLLPVAPLDGSRVVHGLCSLHGSLDRADRVTGCLSRWGIIALAVPAAAFAALGNWSLLLVVGWMAVQER